MKGVRRNYYGAPKRSLAAKTLGRDQGWTHRMRLDGSDSHRLLGFGFPKEAASLELEIPQPCHY